MTLNYTLGETSICKYCWKTKYIFTDSKCSPNPCQNGGTCTLKGYTGYKCQCRPGYCGKNCEGSYYEKKF